MKNIIVVCEDLFGLDVYSILDEINVWYEENGREKPYHFLGYISEKRYPFGNVKHGLNYLGSIHEWVPTGKELYVIGISMPENKKIVVDQLKKKGCNFETVRVPWIRDLGIPIGEGSILATYSVKPDIEIGKFVIAIQSILTSSVGDYSTILRFSNITGSVGDSTYIGNHVYSHLGKTIGNNCYVADGSIIVKDIKSGSSVSGVPARKLRE